MKKLVKALAAFCSAGIVLLLALVLYAGVILPDSLVLAEGEQFRTRRIPFGMLELPIRASLDPYGGQNPRLSLRLFERIPIKQAQVQVVPRSTVIPGGIPFGIKMHTKGVVVVGLSDIQDGSTSANPAKDAGLRIGDILLAIDGYPLSRNADVIRRVTASGGNELTVKLEREGAELELYLTPVRSEPDDGYKAGIWVRDSSAGIGTMTYIDPETMGFAGLGHAICDVDTGEPMPLSHGEIVDVSITGASAGHSGLPGELKGSFLADKPIGELLLNTPAGIYGVLDSPALYADPVPMALRQEISPGPASILATISGNKPERFDILIEKINYSDTDSAKNMVIQITDPDLLSVTGGIVQGMSGSPILQDGRLCGAVTHVFVNDPTKGYGIFAENMDNELKAVIDKKNLADIY